MAKSENRALMLFKLSRQAYGEYKWQILILIILGFAGAFLEGIGVNALIPLFSIALDQQGGGQDVISKFIKRFFEFIGINFSVGYLLGFIIFLFILKAVTNVIFTYIRVKIGINYEKKTRQNLFAKILKANWSHLIRQKSGHLESILMIDTPAAAVLLQEISNAMMMFTSLVIYLLIAINIDFDITLATLVLGGILFLFIKPLTYRIKTISHERVAINKETMHFVGENIVGMKTVKTMNVMEQVAAKGYGYFNRLKYLMLRLSIIKSLSRSLIQPIALIFICLIFWLTYKSPSFNLAALAVVIYLIEKIFTYVQQLQGALNNINEMLPNLRSVLNYEDQALINKEVDRASASFVFNDKLELKNVNFNYNSTKNILINLNFVINKGEMIGIIGPSGVGKTTLVDLILRLFDLSHGEILLDGRNINDINLIDWRRNIGYVSQDIFLTNDTIANNIRFYDNAITEMEIIAAAEMANIDEFIASTPNKYETVIGERGVMLSAGQRQRIVIARILVRKPKILILDEATSALDNESESKIQKVINDLKGKITVIAIAHRLSTVMDSDRLIVLQDGTISEQGDPKKLLKDKDSYFFKSYNIRE